MWERAAAPPPDSVDLSATLDLLASLTQYAEAGAIQPNTIAQAAQHALDEHGDRVEVIVAVAKLYLAVGDRTSAAVVLGRATSGDGAEDARVTQLLVEAGIEITRLGPHSEAKPRSGSMPGGYARQATPNDVRQSFPNDVRQSFPNDVRQSFPSDVRQSFPSDVRQSFPNDVRQSLSHRKEPASDFRETRPREAGPVTPGNRAPLSSGGRSAAAPDPRAAVAPVPRSPAAARRAAIEEPPSSRTPVSLRAPQVGRPLRGSVTVQEQPPKPETSPPTTPRSAGTPEGPALRPTVRMARVTGGPERRWGKAEGREPFDSRPDRDPSSEGPRSARADAGSSNPYLARTAREALGGVRSSRAATGNLKLLDPNDERRKLDRYELIGEIASGGMATVYLARLAGVAGFQRFFAIKRLHPHLADEQEFIDMFLDEARLAAGIHHPNVVPILEVGTSEAGFYLVMDYIEGDTLSGVTSRAATAGGLPRPIALRVLIDALHGLNAAHDLTDADGHPIDLVHRDCSPQNILVGMDGSSRITDFGVARASSRLTTTRSATVKGKLAYLSPEQATGRGLDRRSDLFGMGVILWEALAGRRLFRADSDGATLSRILVEPIPPLAESAPDLPESLCAVVTKALARDPEDRFATAGEMADAIEQAVREANEPDLQVASPRDLAGYMRELFGGEVAARREAVRAWSQQSSEPPAASGPRSYGVRRNDASPPPPSARDARQVDPTRGTQRSLRDLQKPPPESAKAPPAPSNRSAAIFPGGAGELPDDEWEPDSGEEPPSSKTEPSAVNQDEQVQEKPLPIETIEAPPPPREIEPSFPDETPAPAEAPIAAAGAGEAVAEPPAAPDAADPSPSAEKPALQPVPAKPLARRSKSPPTILLILAVALVTAAITAFLLKP